MDGPANWWWRDGVRDPSECAVFDLDGVLSDAGDRQHHLRGLRRDWHAFFAAAGSDAVFPDQADLLALLGRTLQVVILTARPLWIQRDTVDWLDRHGIAYDLLVMRPSRDRRASSAYKKSELDALEAFGFTPRIGFEDDLRNVVMFRSRGVPCVYIHSGYYA